MHVQIEIPDEIGRVLETQATDLRRIGLEAVALEAYRSGAITPLQVQQMLGLNSRWETEAFLRKAEAFHDYTMDDLERDLPNFLDDRRLRYVTTLLWSSDTRRTVGDGFAAGARLPHCR
jgi:hypothetical protein